MKTEEVEVKGQGSARMKLAQLLQVVAIDGCDLAQFRSS